MGLFQETDYLLFSIRYIGLSGNFDDRLKGILQFNIKNGYPFVRDKLYGSSECLPYNNGYFQFEERFGSGMNLKQYNCLYTIDGAQPTDPKNYRYGFSIRTASNNPDVAKNVAGFDIIFKGGGSSKNVQIRAGSPSDAVRLLNGHLNTALTIPGPGEVSTYVYDFSGTSSGGYDSMEVYPILKSGRQCSLGDAITINAPCIGGVTLQ